MHHDHRVFARRLAQDRRHRLAELRARVIQAVVDFVGQQPETVPPAEIEQPLLLFVGGDPSQRIRRRGVEQQPRPRGDGGFERVEVDA